MAEERADDFYAQGIADGQEAARKDGAGQLADGNAILDHGRAAVLALAAPLSPAQAHQYYIG